MRAISAAMQALISGDAIPALATFWLVTRQDGVQIGFTDWSNNVGPFAGVLFQAPPGGSRSALQQRVDLSVPAMEITSIIESDAITDEDIRAGKYDGATIRVFLAVPTDADFLTYGTIILPGAYLGEIRTEDGVYIAEIRGLSYALTQSFVEVFTPTCRADFCDARCTAPGGQVTSVAPFIVETEVVSPLITANTAFSPGAPPVINPTTGQQTSYTFGMCTFTGGANKGYAVEIANSGTIEVDSVPTFIVQLYLPTPYPIALGDTVQLVSGCDKTIDTCTVIYNNAMNYRGEPFVPGANFLFDYGETAG
jgi:uncharacterized phage protein (TIGR02218 family)